MDFAIAVEGQILYGGIMVEKFDIAWPLPVAPHELLVSRRSFV